MKKIICFFIFLFSLSFANAEFHRRLDIYLKTTDLNTAKNVKTAIRNRVTDGDKWVGERFKNIDAEYGKGTMESADEYWLIATHLFANSAKAESVYDWLNNNKGSYPLLHGTISLHYCPSEGQEDIKYDWQGCKDDPRADYKFFSF